MISHTVVRLIVALLLTTWAPVGVVAEPACRPTRPDALGPFYTPDAPERAGTGRGLVLAGRVRSAGACTALAGARLEWWSADGRGEYDDTHRATQVADGDGRFRYETDFPARYPGRPPHVHLRVTAPRHRPLVTQVYPQPGQASIEVDLVLVPE